MVPEPFQLQEDYAFLAQPVRSTISPFSVETDPAQPAERWGRHVEDGLGAGVNGRLGIPAKLPSGFPYGLLSLPVLANVHGVTSILPYGRKGGWPRNVVLKMSIKTDAAEK